MTFCMLACVAGVRNGRGRELGLENACHAGYLYVCDRPFAIVGHVINFLFKPENSLLLENFVSGNSTLQTR